MQKLAQIKYKINHRFLTKEFFELIVAMAVPWDIPGSLDDSIATVLLPHRPIVVDRMRAQVLLDKRHTALVRVIVALDNKPANAVTANAENSLGRYINAQIHLVLGSLLFVPSFPLFADHLKPECSIAIPWDLPLPSNSIVLANNTGVLNGMLTMVGLAEMNLIAPAACNAKGADIV
jgi:hypothetical protein